MAKKKIKDPSECQFASDGKLYAFTAPQVEVNLHGSYKTYTAEQLANGDDDETAEVTAHLVAIRSGVIKVVGKLEDKSTEEKPLTKKELQAILDQAGVTYDPKAKVAALQQLVDGLEEGGE